jgi:hypothetical protein
MLSELKTHPPAWLGKGVSVEEWTRPGSDALIVFRPVKESEPLSAFNLRPSGRWIKVL